jgi:hypothetical protein
LAIRGYCDIKEISDFTVQSNNIMFRLGVRTFTTTARRAAETVAQMEGPNAYGIGVSKAQGIVKGLTGGF